MRTAILHDATPNPKLIQLPGLPPLPAELVEFGGALRDFVDAVRRWPARRPVRRLVPKSFTGQLTLSAVSGEVTRFASQNFQNSRYPFVLQHVTAYATASVSAWRVEIYDKDTGYRLLGDQSGSGVARAQAASIIAGRLPYGDWSPYGDNRFQPVNVPVDEMGYEVGPTGGFGVYAESVGTATVAQVILAGYWILDR